MSLVAVRASLAASWSHPGTRLGFWMHFSTQFSATALSLLWGYPFFVKGEGQSSATAGVLLTVMVLAVMVAGPVLGWLVGCSPVAPVDDGAQHRRRRSSSCGPWSWPGRAMPRCGCCSLLVVVVGVGGPASMIGFDVGRTSNPHERLASASGIINQGGFLASLVLVIVIGLVLDWRTPAPAPTTRPSAFRWAMSAQYVLWAIGLAQVVRYRVRTRGSSTVTSSRVCSTTPAG